MFKKLVSNLSLSPSVNGQLAFYARRLRGERITRRLSALFAVLLIGLQVATMVAPPVAANAASGNDIIFGGVGSLGELLSVYDHGHGGQGQSAAQMQAIFNYFGVSRADLAQSHVGNINSSDHSLASLGRFRHLPSDQVLSIGGQTLFLRGLYTWDTGARVSTGSTYKAFIGRRSVDGGYFAVLFQCGNIVVRNIPKPSPTPTPTATPTPRPVQSIACLGLTSNPANGTLPVTATFTARGQATNQTITGYDFDFGDTQHAAGVSPVVTHTYGAEGNYIAYVRIHGSSGAITEQSSACSAPVQVTSLPPEIKPHKTAMNLTQNVDATTTKANAGDVIRYTLTTENTGGSVSKANIVSEHVEDILEYADVTSAGNGQFANGVITWPAASITAGSSVSETFDVKVKSPIPDTPVSSSDPQSFDLCMDNVYGNLVRVCVPPPPTKQLEAGTQALPQTGPGTAFMIMFAFVGLIVFFYLRNRQLMTEIKILRHDYHGGGQ